MYTYKYYNLFFSFSSEKSNPLPSTSIASYKGKSSQQPQQTGKYGSNTTNSNAPETKVSKNQQINSKPHTPIYVFGDHNLSSKINELNSAKTTLMLTLTNATYETYYNAI